MALINPRAFLQIGGAVLVLVAILGYVGVIGPTSEQSLFGGAWYFDNVENIAHLVLGLVALAAAFVLPGSLQKPLVIVVGVVAVLAGLWSLLVSTSLLGAGLENPADTVLHLVVGAWAIWSGMRA
ncbi:hypothetical protein HY970_01950 [Candidatus Kaiserbacteria bacterium]|nr:hypothetical protein [Candidatus Kaiserbacteria bacterium]